MTGEIIKKYRQIAGIEQAELAALLRISQPQLSRIESGHVVPNAAQLYELAAHFRAPEILLAYIQPYLDKALELSGTSPQEQPERHLLSLAMKHLNLIAEAIDTKDKATLSNSSSCLLTLAKLICILSDNQ